MYELLLLNYILDNKKLVNIDKKFFILMANEYDFILGHFKKYGLVCDKSTFLLKFPNFDLAEVTESLNYIIYKVKEGYTFSKVSKILEGCTKDVEKDSIKASEQIIKNLADVIADITDTDIESCDIIRNCINRAEVYVSKVKSGEDFTISTGLKELDDVVTGWFPEDLVTVFARTNMGKSFLSIFFAMSAWASGKRVLFYSGEMSANMVGYRFDTLYNHFSNKGLLQGHVELGADNKNLDKYLEYVGELSDKEGLYVVTPKELGNKYPTVGDLERLIEVTRADLIVIDQLTLMTDERKGDSKRSQFGNISEDLFKLSEKLQKPIILVTQAKRTNGKNPSEEEIPPDLDKIYESDGVAQASTRVISMAVSGRILKLSLKKNRYGEKDKDLIFLWEKDSGYIKPFLDEEQDLGNEYGF